MSNRNVVPYNPTLLLKYNCHINVEVCSSFASVKYLFKYIHKGHDRIAYHIGDVIDEVKQYRAGRYITVHEAAMRIMEVKLMRSSHSIERLAAHEEGKQAVRFVPDSTDDTSARILSGQRTTLMAFFALCLANIPDDDGVSPRTRLYSEICHYYTWHTANGGFGNLANVKEIVLSAECTPIPQKKASGSTFGRFCAIVVVQRRTRIFVPSMASFTSPSRKRVRPSAFSHLMTNGAVACSTLR